MTDRKPSSCGCWRRRWQSSFRPAPLFLVVRGSAMKMLPSLAALVCASPAFAAPQFSTLYTFPSQKSGDGDYPEAPLTAGPDGTLYGITAFVGKYSGGVIFKLTS